MRTQFTKYLPVKKRGFFLFLFLINISYFLTGEPQTPSNHQVLVKIGDEEITVEYFHRKLSLYSRSPSLSQRLLTLTPKGKKKILEDLITEKVIYKAAKESGIELNEEEKELLKDMEKALIVNKFLRIQMEKKPITEDELKQYYLTHQKEFVIPREVKARHIVVKTEEEAKGILKELKNGGDFEELAKKYNIDGTRERGGYLGWVKKGVMVKPFEDVLFSLKKDEISKVVKTKFGYHIIKAEDIREEEQKPYEAVKSQLKKKIQKERIERLKEKLIRKYGVVINEDLFKKITGGEE